MSDARITQLTENTTPIFTDLLVMVDDPGGSPLTQKVTFSNLFTSDTIHLPLAGGTMTGGIVNSTSVNPLTTLAESWIGPSSTTGIYFKDGNVGIGTNSPSALTTISANINGFDNDGHLELYNSRDTSASTFVGTNYRVRSAGQGKGWFGYAQTTSYGRGDFVWLLDSVADDGVVAMSDEVMRITNSGNVGIGTTAPGYRLDTYTAGNNAIQSYGTNEGSYRARGQGGYLTITTYGTTGRLGFQTDTYNSATSQLVLDSTGNVGIGTTAPTNLLSLGGESARIFWMERELTADTAGNTLTITAGGATAAATNKAGGALILQGGLSTGSAESGVTIQGVVAGASGTADRTQTTAIQVLGNKIGFFAQTPVVRQTELTDELTTITHTAPGTPDYAIQNLTTTTPYGFVTADEGNTALSVIANLQARVNELETKLVAYGLLIDAD